MTTDNDDTDFDDFEADPQDTADIYHKQIVEFMQKTHRRNVLAVAEGDPFDVGSALGAASQFAETLSAAVGNDSMPIEDGIAMVGLVMLYIGHATLVRSGGYHFANQQHETLLEMIAASSLWKLT